MDADRMSYELYRQIILLIKSYGTHIVLGRDVKDYNRFIIMRHDVEFSPERAYKLSLIETQEDFSSNYFFQITNNSYNIFSQRNLEYIREMVRNGHEIGLHFHVNGLTKEYDIREKIQQEIEVMEKMLKIEVKTFSIHRPTPDILGMNISFDNITNAYQSEYFDFVRSERALECVEIKYISDARHQWNYGVPGKEIFNQYKKVQILTHPYSWTESGFDNLNNFKTLIEEKNKELIDSINCECNHFASIKEYL